MQTAVEDHVIYQVANAPLRSYPYPHFYVEEVFPPEFFEELRRNWPSAEQLVSLESTGRVAKGHYMERFIMPLKEREIEALPPDKRAFWSELSAWMLGSTRCFFAIMDKFEPAIRARFGEAFE